MSDHADILRVIATDLWVSGAATHYVKRLEAAADAFDDLVAANEDLDMACSLRLNRIEELEAELARFRPQPATFTADEARALKSGVLTIWLREE